MVMLLRLEGYEVTSAATAEAALRAIDGAHYRPDLIVTDYQLPGGTTGVEVVKTLAARLGFKPPTILLTGDISERLKEDAALVAERILPKPVDIDRLLSELAQFTATPNNH
jgi:two-component system CheB/CheR fusion protein